jgi:hypothetical protein
MSSTAVIFKKSHTLFSLWSKSFNFLSKIFTIYLLSFQSNPELQIRKIIREILTVDEDILPFDIATEFIV